MLKKTVFQEIDRDLIDQIKAQCEDLGIKVCIRKNKQKYAAGGINVTASKKQAYAFQGDQVEKVSTVLLSNGIDGIDSSITKYDDNPKLKKRIYCHGFNFMVKRIEVKDA